MKVSNERSYFNNVRIIVPVILIFLIYDVIKASFSGTIRYSSYSFQAASFIKEKIQGLIDFTIEDLIPFAMELFGAMSEYLIFLIPIAALIFLAKGPLLVSIEVNDEVVLLEKAWFKIRTGKKVLAPADHVIITRHITDVFESSFLFLRFLIIEHKVENEIRTVRFNYSRIKEVQRQKVIGKIISAQGAHDSHKEELEKRRGQKEENLQNPKNPEHWKRVG